MIVMMMMISLRLYVYLIEVVKRADIVVAAVGRAEMVITFIILSTVAFYFYQYLIHYSLVGFVVIITVIITFYINKPNFSVVL
jgi:hypothetical protein